MQLYPFQKETVKFIHRKKGRVLLGHEMGTGKTIITLQYLKERKDLRPVTIICPASLKLNWCDEIKKWLDEDAMVVAGKSNGFRFAPITIINYDILRNHYEEIIKSKVVVLDECSYIKNRKAQRTKIVMSLRNKVPHIIALSGTPIVNRPAEFFNVLNLLAPRLFPNFWVFAHRFCAAKKGYWGWDFTGASNIEELHKLATESCMIRYTKDEVLTELPPKTRSIIPLEIDNRNEYRKAEENIIQWIRENLGDKKAERAMRAETMVQLNVLQRLSVRGKKNSYVEWIEDFIEDDNRKLVVFCTHHETIDGLMERFKDRAVKLDGRDSGEERYRAEYKFKNCKSVQLFIGNVKAAGVGLNLQVTPYVCFLELPWTPGELVQAEDRCHRIGQNEKVIIYYLISRNTIEEKMMAVLESKFQILSAILDGRTAEDGVNLLQSLITILKDGGEQLNLKLSAERR